MKDVRSWKKVYENDLTSLLLEFMDSVDKGPFVLLLEGDLGAGKTTFTRKFIRSLYPNAEISSPTYSLLQETGDILHGDFYRLENVEEIDHLDLDIYLVEKKYFIIEWGKKFFSEWRRFIGDEFTIYLLNIEINSEEGCEEMSRHYFLHKLDLED